MNSYIIDDHTWLKDLLETRPSLRISEVPEEHRVDFEYVVPYILKQCGDEWKGDESVLHPVEDLGDERRPCGLCGRENRYIYYIQNRLNGKKMNVGGDCVEDYVDIDFLREGNSRGKLLRRAKEIRKRSILNQRFPGIQNRIDTWLNRSGKSNVVLPLSIEEPYLNIGNKLQDLHNAFLRGEDNEMILNEMEDILNEEAGYITRFDEYIQLNKDHKFIATKSIMTWLENRRDRKTMESLKQYGFVTKETISFIWEKGFIERNIDSFNQLFESTIFKIIEVDFDNEGFVIQSDHSRVIMIIRFDKFMSNFGERVLGESTKAAFSDNNIVKLSSIYGSNSPYIFRDELKKKLKTWSVGISMTDEDAELNQVYLYDRRKKDYVQVKLSELIAEAKGIVFGLSNPDRKKFEKYVHEKEGKRYTHNELRDIRSISSQMANTPIR